MTDSVVVEGHVKLRDGKKWKSRWLVLRKPSPVADCLLMLVYKDKSERAKGHKERSSMTLEDICGLDPGLSYEGLNHTLAIICLSQVVMLGFENKETMYAWDVRIRYSLGEDPSTNPAYSEERLAHEALQLEKRLSLLSHTSRQGSGGDDRSISSSSSDTSHSDVSVGSRLTVWPEQSSASTSQESHGLAAAKGIHLGEEKSLPEGARGTTKPPPKPLRSRQLQEIGRQSSSDSGIATGSHSSYSGSFSSYAGSLDICHGDEFGSLLSLPLNFPSDQSLCTCPHSESQRGVGSEYQVPSSLRHVYDVPRSVLQAASKEVRPKSTDSTLPKDQAQPAQGASDPKLLLPHLEAQRGPEHSQHRGRPSSLLTESSKDSSDETYLDFVSRWSDTKPQGQVSDSKSSELSPPGGASADPCDTCSPHLGMTRALFSSCPICGGLKGTAVLQSGVLPAISGGASVMAASGSLKVHRGHSLQAGPKGGYEMLTLPSEPGTPTSSEELEGAVGYSADVPTPDRPHSETATYVNIPVSPTSKKQLHYMELELQESSTSIRGGGSSRYAQIDIAATETAHKVGTQHAQCRQERLQELEHKRKGAQQ
uniref:Docking protein 7 n=1 Tax=Catharus ustulatus TaxID=91951 RepID=A0A8C3UJL9_CATUS